MKLERILLISAMPLALALGGCSQNVNVTNNQVNQSGSGSVTISNNSEQKQEISINTASRKYNHKYFWGIPGAVILADNKEISVDYGNPEHHFMVMQSNQEKAEWRNTNELSDIPSNYRLESFDYTSFYSAHGKVDVFYDPGKWNFIEVGGNATPTFLFKEKGFE